MVTHFVLDLKAMFSNKQVRDHLKGKFDFFFFCLDFHVWQLLTNIDLIVNLLQLNVMVLISPLFLVNYSVLQTPTLLCVFYWKQA